MIDPSDWVHGGIRESELAAAGVHEALDFSVNVSPLGPPPGVREALAALDLSRYPDPHATALRQALSEQLRVPTEQILIGNGSAQLIHLVVRLFVRHGQRPVVFAPTFSEFERAVAMVGGHPYPWIARPERQFRWPLKNKPAVLDRVRPPLVWLCNPNNPTGIYLSREQVALITAGLAGGPLFLDEAYINFVESPWSSLNLVQSGRVILLRSMTKDYALAGLRLGYLVARPELIEAVAALQPEWSVSSAAQVAGLAALRAENYLKQMRAVVAEAKAYLIEGLQRCGLDIISGAANFILVRVGDGAAARHWLLRRGMVVRDCTSFGLPEYVRIGVRCLQDCRRLVEAFAALPPPSREE